MKASTIKNMHNIKKNLLDRWYFCMKPLAKLIRYCEDKKSNRKRDKTTNMTFEEVAKLYVKYTVKYMARRKDSIQYYYCCTKKDGYSEYYDDNFILSDLNTFGYSRFNKTKLSGWYYYNKECQAIGYGEGSKDRWISIENKLRELVEKEFIRVGCKVEYVDESDKLDKWFIKQSGYEQTMIVSI